MRILLLEPYAGGSHQAFIDGWIQHSSHQFVQLTLPAHHWKWRMRHAAVTFAQQLTDLQVMQQINGEQAIDVVWASSMLDLASFRGLAPAWVHQLPCVLYFHENQLAYPGRPEGEDDPRDIHFGLTQAHSALAAIASCAQQPHVACCWWNSQYNLDTFCQSLQQLTRKLPGSEFNHVADEIKQASLIMPPGVSVAEYNKPLSRTRKPGPVRLVWAARWEHDKAPEIFFEALDQLCERQIAFEVSVVGERFKQVPKVFDQAKYKLGDRLLTFGFLPKRSDYEKVLEDADIFVSTARHEFYGLSAVEAAALGCVVCVPDDLAYPQVFSDRRTHGHQVIFHQNKPAELAHKLAGLIKRHEESRQTGRCLSLAQQVQVWTWSEAAQTMDQQLNHLASQLI